MAAFSLSESLLAAQDVLEAVLQEVDAAAICQLKAVSVAWCAHARRELCTRLCRREGASITDVNVECLHEAGRLWEVVIAGRQLPQLARLRGFGFVVNLEEVRNADLDAEDDEDDDDAPLGGAALRSCIQGQGEPPHELLLSAVACAARGTVRGVPVQQLQEDELQEDELGSLDLNNSGLDVVSAELLGLMLPATTSVHTLRCVARTTPLAQRAQPAFPPPQGSGVHFCVQRPLTRLLSHHLRPSPLIRSLGNNYIRDEGASALAAILKETQITNLECATAPECLLLCQGPLTPLLFHRFPYPSLADSSAMASEPRAPPRSLPSSTRRRSPSSSAPTTPKPKCLLSCQRPLTSTFFPWQFGR